MSDQRIQQVLDIEKQAEVIRETAIQEAEQLPVQAEKEAKNIIEKARLEAQEEARKIIAKAQTEDEGARILTQAEGNIRLAKALVMKNFDRAVSYIISQVIGKE